MKEKELGKIEALDKVIKLCYDCVGGMDNIDKIESYKNIIRFCVFYKKIIEAFNND